MASTPRKLSYAKHRFLIVSSSTVITMHDALSGSIMRRPLCGNMLMKCASLVALGMRGIENGWYPLGRLFTDDNSGRGSPVQSAGRGLRAMECCDRTYDPQMYARTTAPGKLLSRTSALQLGLELYG